MVQIVRFVLNLSNILIKNSYLPSYIINFYRIVRLFRTVLRNGKGNGPISMHDTVKFTKFWMVIYRFQMIYRYPQEFASSCPFAAAWSGNLKPKFIPLGKCQVGAPKTIKCCHLKLPIKCCSLDIFLILFQTEEHFARIKLLQIALWL